MTAGANVTVTDIDPRRAAVVSGEVGASAAPMDDAGGLPCGEWDGILVASPTVHHRAHVEAALETSAKVLVEKPLASTAVDAAAVAATAPERLAVAYNLRFHEPLQRLAARLDAGDAGEVSAIRLWFGSWLPDWRPGTDYRRGYSARADLGGGVLLDAIHELDLLLWLAGPGPWSVVGSVVERLGPLEIDTEDTVHAVLRAPGKVADVSLDYLARRYRRGVEVTGDEATLRLDWARSTLEVEVSDGVKVEAADVSVDRAYERQTEAFVGWLRGGDPLPVDSTEGARSVALADAIRAAAR